MRQVPLERDINIAVNGCSGFTTSTQKGPFMAMLISLSRGTYLIAFSKRRTPAMVEGFGTSLCSGNPERHTL